MKAERVSDSQLLVSWTIEEDGEAVVLENTVLLRQDKLSAEFKTSCRLRDTLPTKEKAVVLVIRTRLCQSQNFELSGTAVAVLVHALQKKDARPSEILQGCLRTYGLITNNWEEQTVSMEGFVTKVHPDPVSIKDPINPAINLGRKCRNVVVIKGGLRHASVAMETTLKKRDTKVLESIIGYQKLRRPAAAGGGPRAVDLKERALIKEKEEADEKIRQAVFVDPAPADQLVFLTGGHQNIDYVGRIHHTI